MFGPRDILNDSIIREVNDSKPSRPKLVSDASFGVAGVMVFPSSIGVIVDVRLGVVVDMAFAGDEPAPVAALDGIIDTSYSLPSMIGSGIVGSSGGNGGVQVKSEGPSAIMDAFPASLILSSTASQAARPIKIIPISLEEKLLHRKAFW